MGSSDPSRPKCAPPSGHCKNFAVKDGLCRMHHPDFRETRAAAGKVRHPRFARVIDGMPEIDRSKTPTVPYIIDLGLDIAKAVARGDLEPSQANAMVYALRLARDGLEAELARAEKTRFAWEEQRRAQNHAGVAPSVDAAPALPPWMVEEAPQGSGPQ